MINSSHNSAPLFLPLTQVRLASWLVMLVPLSLLVLSSGCSSLQLPRIDPSGRSIFLPSNNTTSLIGSQQTGSVGLPQVSQPLPSQPFIPTAQAVPAPTLQAPVTPNSNPFRTASGPAFQQPARPPACDGSDARNVRKPKLSPDPNRTLSPGQAGQMLMTPSRIVAPVGSEVVVIAGICGSDGFFAVNQPLEWMLSNDSVGQFVEIGGTHHPTFNKLIGPSSKKIRWSIRMGTHRAQKTYP